MNAFSRRLAALVVFLATGSPVRSAEPVPAEEIVPGGTRGDVRGVGDGVLAFRYDGPAAASVILTGGWDDWQGHPLEPGVDGVWRVDLAVPEGDHAYRYIVDDLPALDPANAAVDLGPDGGLVSRISIGPDFEGLDGASVFDPEVHEEPEELTLVPTIGPLDVGLRYHGRIDADVAPPSLPSSRHALDLPLRAGFTGRGHLDALLRAGPDDGSGELELFRLRSFARVGRSRIQVTRNASLGDEGTFRILQPIGRHRYPVGLDGDGVSVGIGLGGLKANTLHLVRDAGLLGPASRVSAGALSGRAHGLRWQWSFARESDRNQRFVDADGIPVIPVPQDTVTVESRRSQGWHGSVLMPLESVEWFGHVQAGSDRWVADEVVRHLEPGAIGDASGEDIRSTSWSASLGCRAVDREVSWEGSTTWEVVDNEGADDSRAWESGASWTCRSGDDEWRLAGRYRALNVPSAAADPSLSPWIWRGPSDAGEDDEVGRVPWRELSLLGLAHTLRVEGSWRRSGLSAQWASTWGSGGDGTPLLSVVRIGIEEDLPRDLSLRADVESVGRSQGGTDSWTVCPFAELVTSPSPGLVVSLGVGVDPWVDDPLTREISERGREDHLRSVAGYGALAQGSLEDRLSRIREAEHDLCERFRVGLEVVYEFGLRRPRASGER